MTTGAKGHRAAVRARPRGRGPPDKGPVKPCPSPATPIPQSPPSPARSPPRARSPHTPRAQRRARPKTRGGGRCPRDAVKEVRMIPPPKKRCDVASAEVRLANPHSLALGPSSPAGV